jgi:hypothetical protein
VIATAAPPAGTPTPTAAPVVGQFAGEWFHNFGRMRVTQAGATLTGTFDNAFSKAAGTVEGTVEGTRFTGTWASAGASGPVQWTLGADGTTFSGSFTSGRALPWCGARPDQPFPDGCSFAGAWNNQINDGGPCAMQLQRVNVKVTGTYCAGSLDGAIVAHRNNPPLTVVEGTWNVAGIKPGPFTLYLIGFEALQFQGNWRGDTPNEWCGWRATSQPPSPCLMS